MKIILSILFLNIIFWLFGCKMEEVINIQSSIYEKRQLLISRKWKLDFDELNEFTELSPFYIAFSHPVYVFKPDGKIIISKRGGKLSNNGKWYFDESKMEMTCICYYGDYTKEEINYKVEILTADKMILKCEGDWREYRTQFSAIY